MSVANDGIPKPTALIAGHAAVLFVLFPNYSANSVALVIALIAVAIGFPLAAGAWAMVYFPNDDVPIAHQAFVALVGYVASTVALVTAVGALLYRLADTPWIVVLFIWPLALLFWAGNPQSRLGRWVGRWADNQMGVDEEE